MAKEQSDIDSDLLEDLSIPVLLALDTGVLSKEQVEQNWLSQQADDSLGWFDTQS